MVRVRRTSCALPTNHKVLPVAPPLVVPPSPNFAAGSATPLVRWRTDPTFKLFGISPIWGKVHRSLLDLQRRNGVVPDGVSSATLAWFPEKDADFLGVTITKQQAPRVVSPWGTLISADATSDPSRFCFEAFQRRRIPLTLYGTLYHPVVVKRLQQLMIDAPTEFSSLYWGMRAEFACAGRKLLPGADGIEFAHEQTGKKTIFFNAGQTTQPTFFVPQNCVAFTPFMVPEMKHAFRALAHYWDVVLNRGRFKFSDEWLSEEFVRSRGLALKKNARCVNGRYNMYDLLDFRNAFPEFAEIRQRS